MARIRHIGIHGGSQQPAVLAFYEGTFGLTEVQSSSHRFEKSEVYLSDGNINVALLSTPPDGHDVGWIHFGFEVEDADALLERVGELGGHVGDRERPKDGRFAECSVIDPIGTNIDLSVQGWKLSPPSDGTLDRPFIQHFGIFAGEDFELVGAFYEQLFGMQAVHTTNRSIYISDGYINLAILKGGPEHPVGEMHFGFKVDDFTPFYAAADQFGGKVLGAKETTENRFAEAAVVDPVGTVVDVSIRGWRTEPGGPPYDLSGTTVLQSLTQQIDGAPVT